MVWSRTAVNSRLSSVDVKLSGGRVMEETRIAAYIRLSSADEETGKSKDESDSVVNQRSLIHHFLDTNPELSGCPRTEFIDDGFTGTNTDRPAFQRMIRQIREGCYNLCITKDFSRFSRDYIEMGDYLECVFPFLNVRYISINDGYDSDDYKGTTGGLDIVMRMIIYDAYSKDLSVKCKTGKIQNMKKGRRVCGHPGYGYMRDPYRKGMDVIDPEAAEVVREIFDSAIGGMGPGKIARKLNEEGILTPSVYFQKKNPESKKFSGHTEKKYWDYRSVYDILKRYAYTGASVGEIRESIAPCSKVTMTNKFEDRIIVPDMHEAIITPEEFALAQKAIGQSTFGKTGNGDESIFPLKSLVMCGNCKRRMTRLKARGRFRCSYSFNGGDADCIGIKVNEDELVQTVFDAIQNYIDLTDKKNNRIHQKKHGQMTDGGDNNSVSDCKRRIEALKQEKFLEYERYLSGMISRDLYLVKKQELDSDIENLESEMQERMRHDFDKHQENRIRSELDAVCEAYRQEQELTYEMAHAFVERILVYHDARIEINWKFRDCFEEMEKEGNGV